MTLTLPGPQMFYIKCNVLQNQPYPEPVEIRGTTANKADLDEADIVITNIQQLPGAANRRLQACHQKCPDSPPGIVIN